MLVSSLEIRLPKGVGVFLRGGKSHKFYDGELGSPPPKSIP